MGQNKEMRDQGKELTKATTALSHHLEESKEASRELRATMREQRQINQDTSSTLIGLLAEQKTLSAKNDDMAKSLDKLADEIRNRHSRRPD